MLSTLRDKKDKMLSKLYKRRLELDFRHHSGGSGGNSANGGAGGGGGGGGANGAGVNRSVHHCSDAAAAARFAAAVAANGVALHGGGGGIGDDCEEAAVAAAVRAVDNSGDIGVGGSADVGSGDGSSPRAATVAATAAAGIITIDPPDASSMKAAAKAGGAGNIRNVNNATSAGAGGGGCPSHAPHERVLCCRYCAKLYPQWAAARLPCAHAPLLIDARGRLVARHAAAEKWSLTEFVGSLHLKGMTWEEIYWLMWGTTHVFRCKECASWFTADELGRCAYHPHEPLFRDASPAAAAAAAAAAAELDAINGSHGGGKTGGIMGDDDDNTDVVDAAGHGDNTGDDVNADTHGGESGNENGGIAIASTTAASKVKAQPLPTHLLHHGMGVYPCCRATCLRFNAYSPIAGCRFREHKIDEVGMARLSASVYGGSGSIDERTLRLLARQHRLIAVAAAHPALAAIDHVMGGGGGAGSGGNVGGDRDHGSGSDGGEAPLVSVCVVTVRVRVRVTVRVRVP